MSSNFTLDDIRAAAERKYGSVQITLDDGYVVTLVNVLQLSKEKREAFIENQKRYAEDDADQVAITQDGIRIVADSEESANRLLNAVGDNLAHLMQVLTSYSMDTELGEA